MRAFGNLLCMCANVCADRLVNDPPAAVSAGSSRRGGCEQSSSLTTRATQVVNRPVADADANTTWRSDSSTPRGWDVGEVAAL